LAAPHYLIDKFRLLPKPGKMAWLHQTSGAKSLLPLKYFATWSVFDFMAQCLDGTTSSSLYELRLGREKFPGETYARSVVWADHEIDKVVCHCDKVIFNTLAQLLHYDEAPRAKVRDLRVTSGASSSSFDLADPPRPFSRLGDHGVQVYLAPVRQR
jgi:carboxynorspermidine decarboxylase